MAIQSAKEDKNFERDEKQSTINIIKENLEFATEDEKRGLYESLATALLEQKDIDTAIEAEQTRLNELIEEHK